MPVFSRRYTLRVAWLDGLPVIRFRLTCCVFKEFSDFLVKSIVEVSGDVFVGERFFDLGLDNEVCHTCPIPTACKILLPYSKPYRRISGSNSILNFRP